MPKPSEITFELAALTTAVCDLVKQVGAFIQIEAGKVKAKNIQEKSLNSLVSYVDLNAEQKLVAGLQELLPEAGFIVEENTKEQTNALYQWVVDPLDGTTNFLYNIPSYGVSVALMKGEEVILGVVYEVNREECFYAWQNGGAFLNGKKIRTSKNERLEKALIATGFPYYDFHKMEQYLKILQYFMRHTRGIRRLGAAAIDLCYVACGRFDGFFEYSLSPWDVAAGSLIVQEAGGAVTDFQGGYDYIFGKEIIASSSMIRPAFFKAIKQ